MKTNILISAFLIIGLLLFGCDNSTTPPINGGYENDNGEKEPPTPAEPFLEIDKTSITAIAKGGTFSISVSSNGEWTAVVQDAENHSWFTLINDSGIDDGVITVNIEENPRFIPRSATVEISMGSLTEVVTVQQEAAEDKRDFPIEIPVTEFSLIGTACEWRIFGVDWSGEIFIINCNEELKNYIVCDDFPVIDFSTQTLLLVKGIIFNFPIYDILIETKQVSAYNYIVDILIVFGDWRGPNEWNTAFLIPRIDSDANIALNVRQKWIGYL